MIGTIIFHFLKFSRIWRMLKYLFLWIILCLHFLVVDGNDNNWPGQKQINDFPPPTPNPHEELFLCIFLICFNKEFNVLSHNWVARRMVNVSFKSKYLCGHCKLMQGTCWYFIVNGCLLNTISQIAGWQSLVN